MLTKFVVAFCVLALAAGFAGSVPTKTATYHIVLSEPATVNGTVALKAGEYRVTVAGDTVTFQFGRDSKEVAATYHIVLSEPATVNGTVALKAGEYRVT